MIQNSEYIDQLIFKFFDKSSTPDEDKELVAWIIADKDNEIYFVEQQKLYAHAQTNTSIDFDTEAELQKFLKNSGIQKPKSRTLWYALSGIAASIILIVSIWFGLQPNSTTIEKPVTIAQTKFSTFSSADSVQEIILEDKSIVTLNNNSSIKAYSFADSIRTVDLQGTAFFQVSKNPRKPFTITVDFAKVTVLGTSFEISENLQDSSITISVVEGKVRVTNTLNQATKILTANQTYTLWRNKKPLFAIAHNQNNMAWKTGILEFKDTPLPIALEAIGKLYHKSFVTEVKKFDSFLFNATFNKTTFADVKTVLKYTLNANIQDNDSIIIITAK